MKLLQTLCSFVVVAVALAAHPPPSLSTKTLVVFDPKLVTIADYSSWIQQLESTGLEVVVTESTADVSLFSNGARQFQNVIVLPAKQRTLGSDITGASLLNFFNDGGDVLVITSPEAVSESVRTFVNELGIFPSPKQHSIVDHFKFASEDHNVIKLSDDNIANKAVLSSTEHVTYQGSAALLSNNPLIVPLLQAPTTSYTKSSKEDDTSATWAIGKQAYLAAGLQGLNNARAVWIGDEKLFTNSQIEQNSGFVNDISQWVFQIKNVIRATSVSHSHVDGTTYEETPYKIKDEVQYTIGFQQWDGSNWVPFFADDIQFEVKLLDPYHRLNLTLLETTDDSAIYQATFPLPDKHGVFSFHTDYKRPGLSFVDEKVILSIRHLANDEYPRSWEITNSWVYITSAIVVFIGWFVFLLAFIYGKDSKDESKKEK
ncbi:Dolichyl-diphosphooligosaccharide--protein glycosyltransferase subunit WBP1 [Cyberlindnera fabianii]|uniref:Dolichyl-diphosphooligosaccharide--protein glycosyltransferase subunit WBP1 n=1 Tax=Cyberlindnera fabianii TaxID=36022 RepID=A0A1V2KZ24_CYBFA|nr:Dolichyl-diphosphooligosaccharide--protein glycosyltransferase subunit WBP1 [Cyberlindnera fabianii]